MMMTCAFTYKNQGVGKNKQLVHGPMTKGSFSGSISRDQASFHCECLYFLLPQCILYVLDDELELIEAYNLVFYNVSPENKSPAITIMGV